MAVMKTLLLPSKPDPERSLVASAWEHAGGKVCFVDKFWVRPDIAVGEDVAIYGNDTFALVLAQVMDVELLSPDDALLARLSPEWTQRKVSIRQLTTLQPADFPCFAKPVIAKQFQAGIFQTLAAFSSITEGLELVTEILISEIVVLSCEVRVFVLDNVVQAIAVYEGDGDLQSAMEFATQCIREIGSLLPRTYVMDLGFSLEKGWFVVEFNAVWGAGLNGCIAEKVVACIAAGTVCK
jgi:hypothetical protein